MALRMALEGAVLFEPCPLLRYRKHPTSASSNSKKMYKSHLFFRAKWRRHIRQMPRSAERRRLAQAFIFDQYLAAELMRRAAFTTFQKGQKRETLRYSISALKKIAGFFIKSAFWIRYL
jgi:hypothetical protein